MQKVSDSFICKNAKLSIKNDTFLFLIFINVPVINILIRLIIKYIPDTYLIIANFNMI